MSHLLTNKAKLISRVRKIRGQVDAIEKALNAERECSAMLQMISACRCAINGLMSEVMEGHIQKHVIDPRHKPTAEQLAAAEELISVLKSYLR